MYFCKYFVIILLFDIIFGGNIDILNDTVNDFFESEYDSDSILIINKIFNQTQQILYVISLNWNNQC